MAAKPPNKPTIGRKPSFKKPPEVRQTLSSKYRLLKANPLLMYELENKLTNQENTDTPRDSLVVKPLKILAKSLDNYGQASGKPTKVAQVQPVELQKRENFAKPKAVFKPTGHVSKNDFRSGQFLSSTRIESVHKPAVVRKDNFNKIKPTRPLQTGNIKTSVPVNIKVTVTAPVQEIPSQKPFRRSLSAQHFEKKQGKSSIGGGLQVPGRAVSFEDLSKTETLLKPGVSPIVEETGISFKTPSAYNRRSVYRTPNTDTRKSLFLSTPSSDELRKRLNDWLKKRGKSAGGFHHLKCFGYHGHFKKTNSPPEENSENKENVATNIVNGESYEDLKIVNSNFMDVNREEGAVGVDYEKVAKEALTDLHKLITEGYPGDQCEAWLKLIKLKCSQLEAEPQYWECRAAVEQARGNISSAVECYKTAIVQGAEVTCVDEALDQLLRKFSLLQIESEQDNGGEKGREKVYRDARNIFKSSIIQFAVQERTLKKNNEGGLEKRLVATPVRRSTRLSRSHFTSTPGVKVYSSLKEVDSPVRNKLAFESNRALCD